MTIAAVLEKNLVNNNNNTYHYHFVAEFVGVSSELGVFAQDVRSEVGTSFHVGRGVLAGGASAHGHLVCVFRTSTSLPTRDARGHDHAHGCCAVAATGSTADTSTSIATAAPPAKSGQVKTQAQAGVQAAATKNCARHYRAASPSGHRTDASSAPRAGASTRH